MPQCKHFLPDPIGFGQGIGNCQLLIDYRAKGADDQGIEHVRRKYLGTALLWAGSCHNNERRCLRYEPIEPFYRVATQHRKNILTAFKKRV